MSTLLTEKYNDINNSKLISILSKIEKNPIFLDDEIRLLSEEEVLTLNKQLEIGNEYIILIDCFDNNYLCYSKLENEFKIYNIDDNIFYDSKNIEKIINTLI